MASTFQPFTGVGGTGGHVTPPFYADFLRDNL